MSRGLNYRIKAERRKKNKVTKRFKRSENWFQYNNPYFLGGIISHQGPCWENKVEIGKASKSNTNKNSFSIKDLITRSEVKSTYYVIECLKDYNIRPSLLKKYPKVKPNDTWFSS